MTAPHNAEFYDETAMERGEFWYYVTINEGKESERVELKIDYRRFVRFLEREGFGLLLTDKQVQVVRVLDNVVSDTLKEGSMNVTVKRFVLDWLIERGHDDVENLMYMRHSTFFCTAFLTALQPLTLTFYRDARHESAIFFRNGFLHIERRKKEAARVRFLPFKALKGCIWTSHILNLDYAGRHHKQPIIPPPDRDDQAEILTFLKLCSTEFDDISTDEQRLTTWKHDEHGKLLTNIDAFRYAIGYACHTFKNPANARALVGVDDDARDITDANGGRGKSIVAQIIGHVRRMCTEDGRTLKTDGNQFVLQSVELDSQIVLIDDAAPNFKFEILYNSITGVFALERKGQQRILLSFKDSPKVFVTTNYALLGDGDSHARRWLILPFVKYFSARYTPQDEFGHTLFDDWSAEEWMRFYDFVADCLAFYLQSDRPVLANTTRYDDSKLQASLPGEALAYFEQEIDVAAVPDDGLTVYHEFLFDGFKWRYPLFEKKCTSNTFTRYLKTYCKAKELDINKGIDGRQWRTVPDATGDQRKVQQLIITKRGKHHDHANHQIYGNEEGKEVKTV